MNQRCLYLGINHRCRRRLSSASASQSYLDDLPPPVLPLRRVVVTGMSLVSPLGCGVESTWWRLIDGGCEIWAISREDLKMEGFDEEARSHAFNQLTCKVTAFVPCRSGTTNGSGDGDDSSSSEFNEDL